jgi:lipoyl-dependent peroxiredoxin
MKINRTGSAQWSGGIKDGKGSISTQSGALAEHPYGFASRFEGKAGTNPEELLASAHAGCFTMALSLILGNAGFTATTMSTTATVSLEQVEAGYSITAVQLKLEAQIPGVDDATFQQLAKTAKENCPVSKVLNAAISLEAKLVA